MTSRLTVDSIAALRWRHSVPQKPAWLSDEMGRRLASKLSAFTLSFKTCWHVCPLLAGVHAQKQLMLAYPKTQFFLNQETAAQTTQLKKELGYYGFKKYFKKLTNQNVIFTKPSLSVDLIWQNGVFHTESDPAATLVHWHQHLNAAGVLLFSCFASDTLKELKQWYDFEHWPAPAQNFPDMHDIGDLLLRTGFRDPVVEAECLTLTYDSPECLLKELRLLGKNLHPKRAQGLKTEHWLKTWLTLMQRHYPKTADGKYPLTFEIVYAYASKAIGSVQKTSHISLQDFKNQVKVKNKFFSTE